MGTLRISRLCRMLGAAALLSAALLAGAVQAGSGQQAHHAAAAAGPVAPQPNSYFLEEF